MSQYKITDIVYCTNTTWLHEKCIITEIVQNSTVPEETVYEAQSLSSNEILLVSEDCITLTPKLNIKQLRISTRLSQAKFAHKFEIPTRTLQKWEIGQSSPPPYVISMMQQILEQEKALPEKGTKPMLENENIKLNIVGGGMGMADTEINGRIIAVRNYGIVIPKGYKLGFVVDNQEKEQILTASKKFKEITGYDELPDDDSAIKSCVDYIIKKYC